MLDIKAKEEQKKRAELLGLTEKLAATRSELLTQQRILEDIICHICHVKPEKRLGRQELFLKSSVTNDELIGRLKNRVSELESKQREKIAEVLKARRFKEGLEKLRDRAKKQFIKDQEKLEQKEFDEGATISFARKMMKHGKSGDAGD